MLREKDGWNCDHTITDSVSGYHIHRQGREVEEFMQWVLNTRWYTLVHTNVSGHLELPVGVTGKSMMVVDGVWCSVEWCGQK